MQWIAPSEEYFVIRDAFTEGLRVDQPAIGLIAEPG
jgi:hypothetical protein